MATDNDPDVVDASVRLSDGTVARVATTGVSTRLTMTNADGMVTAEMTIRDVQVLWTLIGQADDAGHRNRREGATW